MKMYAKIALLAAILTSTLLNTADAQERQLERLGPIPKDQQSNIRGRRVASIPLVQQDATRFSREGERILRIEPRIVGGTPAPIGAYPWQVSIGLNGIPFSTGHFCGGSIIASEWVLTAAHCVHGSTNPANLEVLYGTNLLSQGGEKVRVERIIVHNDWDSNNYDFDVALLKVSSPMTSASIPLVDQESAENLAPVGVLAFVSGWGLTSENGYVSNVLQHVGVQVTSSGTCNSPTSYPDQITDRMMCAGFATGGQDSCQGDSGGPLVVFNRAGGFALVGIVSWGEGCARPSKYGVYTRVSSVSAWVDSNLNQNIMN